MNVVVMTMNVNGLSHKEFRSILDEMGVEARPERGIYEHISHPTRPVSGLLRFGSHRKALRNSQAAACSLLLPNLGLSAKRPSAFSRCTTFLVPVSMNCRIWLGSYREDLALRLKWHSLLNIRA
jgi:hypothetical protein